jgi:hypothetical protein
VPVLSDSSGNPIFFAVTGESTGTISGAATGEAQQDGLQ